MTRAEAHLLCAALLVADGVARGLRLQWLLRGMGVPVRFDSCVISNAVADLAAALSPMRMLGLPAHAAALERAGVPLSAAAAALALEALVSYPIAAIVGIAIALQFGENWWETIGPPLLERARAGAPALALIVAAGLLALVAVRRWLRRHPRAFGSIPAAPSRSHRLAAGIGRTIVLARGTRPLALAAAIPATFVNVVTRVLLLPVLAQTIADPPPTGITIVGSFVLLYGQLLIPTPSGAGVIELAGAAGAAGPLRDATAWVLAWWRVYSNASSAMLLPPLLLLRLRRRHDSANLRSADDGV